LQHASRHARTLRPAAAVELLVTRPFLFADRVTGAELVLARPETNSVQLSAKKASEQHRLRLRWAFGSGAQGITFVGNRDDGQAVEARLTWYQSLNGFDLTTGATKHTPVDVQGSLGRELSPEELKQCLGCHGTGAEMGVQCESCHGPGTDHIEAVKAGRLDRKIIHPGRLDAFGQIQLCGNCHGRPPEDTDLAGLRSIESNPNTIRFASPRLVLSRCFNESAEGLKCQACHDPHLDAAKGAAAYDPKCRGCHDQSKRKRAVVCRVGKENCSACHMPRSQVMAHSSFTDHWIRVTQ
jgi:formate-dependent nitrite reductase cytochrome c552 subunit